MPLTQSSYHPFGDLAATVAANVRAELARRQMTAAELASLIGVTPYYLGRRIGRQQRQGYALDVAELGRIAAALGVSPQSFLAPGPPTDIPEPRRQQGLPAA